MFPLEEDAGLQGEDAEEDLDHEVAGDCLTEVLKAELGYSRSRLYGANVAESFQIRSPSMTFVI